MVPPFNVRLGYSVAHCTLLCELDLRFVSNRRRGWCHHRAKDGVHNKVDGENADGQAEVREGPLPLPRNQRVPPPSILALEHHCSTNSLAFLPFPFASLSSYKRGLAVLVSVVGTQTARISFCVIRTEDWGEERRCQKGQEQQPEVSGATGGQYEQVLAPGFAPLTASSCQLLIGEGGEQGHGLWHDGQRTQSDVITACSIGRW